MKMFNLSSCLIFCFLSQVSLSAQVIYQEITGKNLNIGTVLNWTTLEEGNLETFIVEKSNNGAQYFPVFECFSQKGELSTTEYSFLDIKTNDPIAFYRIKEKWSDGTFSYSEIIQVSKNFQNNLLVEQVSDISDAKEKGILSVYYSSIISGKLTYSIVDQDQEVLSTEENPVFMGPNLLAIDFSLFPKGEYTLKMQMDEEIELILFEKLDNQLNFEVSNEVPRSFTVKNRQK